MEQSKYTVYFKNTDGSHNSTKTMSFEEYKNFLERTINAMKAEISIKDHPYPSLDFEVEKRTIIFKTKMKNDE